MAVYVAESGPAEAPTIVFLHGGGASGWMWGPQVERLGDYHCLVPDLPEHGRSVAEKPFTMAGAVAQIADLIRTRAHGGRAHVVGLSEGGQLTLWLLSRHADLVDHAIASGTLVRPMRGAGLFGVSLRLYWPIRTWGFLVRANMKNAGIPMRYFADSLFDLRVMSPAGMTRAVAEGLRNTLPPGLVNVQVPTLIVHGEKEPKSIHASARDLLAAMPSARGYVAPGLGHPWNLQAPDLFTNMVRAWITDRPLPTELRPLA